MRFRKKSAIIVSLIDGQVLQGVTTWSWRWKTLKLVQAFAFTLQGEVPTAGIVYIPHRSILMVQEVSDVGA